MSAPLDETTFTTAHHTPSAPIPTGAAFAGLRIASLRRRSAAAAIDFGLVLFVSALIVTLAALVSPGLILVLFIVAGAYLVYVNSSGVSCGKALVGLRVVRRLDLGAKPGLGCGVLRSICIALSSAWFLLVVDWAFAGSDRTERRTLHDRAAGTVVVRRTPQAEPALPTGQPVPRRELTEMSMSLSAPLAEFRPLGALAFFTVALLLLYSAVAAGTIANEFDVLDRLYDSERVEVPEIGKWFRFEMLAWFVTVPLFLAWTSRATANLTWFGAPMPKHYAKRSVEYFVVPFIALWRPCSILLQTWRGSGSLPAEGEQRKTRGISYGVVLILAWWCAFAVGWVVWPWVITLLVLVSSSGGGTRLYSPDVVVILVADIAMAVAAVLCIVMVVALSRRQAAAARTILAESP